MSLPPMGPECIPDQTCTRSFDPDGWANNCGKPATHHIIWRDPNGPLPDDDGWGFGCSEHHAEAIRLWTPWSTHEVTPFCGMPGSVLRWVVEDGEYKTWCDADPELHDLTLRATRAMEAVS